FFQAEDGIRDLTVTGVQTCALPILVFRAFALSGGASALPLALLTLAPEHIADARLTVALSDVFALAIVVAKLVFVERADRHFDAALAVREDDRLVRDNRAEVLADRLFDALLVPFLIDDAFALQRPIVALNRHLNNLKSRDDRRWETVFVYRLSSIAPV